jgi:mitofilin
MPHLQEAGFGKFLLILSPIAVSGGVIAYAKYDNEFRKLLVKNVPAIEPVLEVFIDDKNPFDDVSKKFGEYKTTVTSSFSSLSSSVSSITSSVSNITSSVTNLFGSEEKKPEKPFKYEPTSSSKIPSEHKTSTAPVSQQTSTIPVPSPPISKPPETSSPKESPVVAKKVAVAEKPQAVEKPKEEKVEIPKSLTDFEKSVEAAAKVALKEYSKAVNVLKSYNEEVKKIVDSAVENIDVNAWTALKNKTLTRDAAVEVAEQAALAARKKLQELEHQIENNVVNISNEAKSVLKNHIEGFNEHLNAAKLEVIKAKQLAGTSENYWRKVEAARGYFVKEIESLFGVNLNEKKLNLSKEDIDLFLVNAYSHVMTYQKELQKLQTEGELKLKRAIDAVRGSDHSEAVKAQLAYELEKERRELNIQNQSKIIKIKAETERNLKDQLKKQIEAHTDHLNDALSQKEAEMKRLFNRELDERLANERASYNTQLAIMLGKIKGMDAALKERADNEKSAYQAQSLWASCQALWSSMREGEPGKSWRVQLRPLKSEINAVKSAAEGDELVAVVINSLPEKAQNRGVFPEAALRERFVNVFNVARKLALVPAEGASLPVYLLSFIQGVLIATPSEPITQDELLDKEFDFSKLDTYDITNRARYWMERGNFVQALRYMNLLQGASRKVSSQWMEEVKLLLETQQAVNLLMGHASANSNRYL